MGQVNDDDNDFLSFKEFIEDFFSKSSVVNESEPQLSKWLSSVENSHLTSVSNSSESTLRRLMQKESIE